MKYLKDYKDGDRVSDIYLCKNKQSAITKNGKSYDNVILQDKTGTMDAKVWDPNSAGIGEYDTMDYIEVYGEISSFQGALQLSVKRVRLCQEGEYDPADYLPVTSKNIDSMYQELIGYINKMENRYLKLLMEDLFIKDEAFIKVFKASSAAKSVHHGFAGGLLEHTYPLLKKDLLISAALCHDIGKTKELSLFPENDYTDDGNLIGHIVMGVEMIGDKIREIDGFPESLATELKHCVIAHHGELAYGSPKKPALMEAVALNLADNTDAKMQTFSELLLSTSETGWIGYNRLFESNVRMTRMEQ